VTDGQADRQTDGQTDRISISISRVSMLTRDNRRRQCVSRASPWLYLHQMDQNICCEGDVEMCRNWVVFMEFMARENRIR